MSCKYGPSKRAPQWSHQSLPSCLHTQSNHLHCLYHSSMPLPPFEDLPAPVLLWTKQYTKGSACQFKKKLKFPPPTIFRCCAMTMDSPMLSPRYGGPRYSTSLAVVPPLSDDASGGLTNILKVGEGSGTSDKRLGRFSGVTINNRSLDRH